MMIIMSPLKGKKQQCEAPHSQFENLNVYLHECIQYFDA